MIKHLSDSTLVAIKMHYIHAQGRHPYFCDRLQPFHCDETDASVWLKRKRLFLKEEIERGDATAAAVLDCELYEIYTAIAQGDSEQAIQEIYDAIAVLLRMKDVIEGTQPLGKPQGEQING